MRKSAWAVSVLFHPLLLTTYLFLLISLVFPTFFQPFSTTFRNWFVLLLFVLTVIMPSLNIWMFRKSGTITDVTMPERKERIIPFLWILGVYALTAYLFYSRLSFNQNVLGLLLICTILVGLALFLTLFFKVSIHSLGMGGALAIVLMLNFHHEQPVLIWPTALTFGLTGVVMSARLYIGTHQPFEVYAGAAAGFAAGTLGMLLIFR